MVNYFDNQAAHYLASQTQEMNDVFTAIYDAALAKQFSLVLTNIPSDKVLRELEDRNFIYQTDNEKNTITISW